MVVLRKVGIEWKRRAESRMVLNERHHSRRRSANHCRDTDKGILCSVAECGRKALPFGSEKLSTTCSIGLMIDFNNCDK